MSHATMSQVFAVCPTVDDAQKVIDDLHGVGA
jgi:hypothetical protein